MTKPAISQKPTEEKSLSIFDLNKAYADFCALIQQNEGELTDEHLAQLEAIERALIQKADSIVWVLQKLEADASFYDAQAKQMTQWKSFFQKSHERLKNFCVEALKVNPEQGIVGGVYSLGLKKNPPSVSILDEQKVPKEYKTQVISETIDKKTIASDLKAGVPVEGCVLTQGVSLKIGRAK